MTTPIDFPDGCFKAGSATAKVVIIYEDFDSGTRAKHFTERLAEELGSDCQFSLWRSELLGHPEFAGEAAREVADCDYLIVSLRGDGVLPRATRRWIEAQLDGAAGRGVSMIALLGSDGGKRRVLEGNRNYLRTICAARGVEFFAMAASPVAEGAASFSNGRNKAAPSGSAENRWLLPLQPN